MGLSLDFTAAHLPVIAQAPITVWFGSQTGTAEGYAKQLAKEAIKHGFECVMQPRGFVALVK